MKKIVAKMLEQILMKKGIILQKATDKDNIIELIKSLHPIKTEHELIRLGPNGDGGYLVPENISGIEACFSPGVDRISDFELDCSKHDMKLFMADKSVDKPNIKLSTNEFNFIKKFVGSSTNNDFITMDDWVRSSNVSESSDLLLQMDIEGGEYDTILNMSDGLIKRFRIMVIEFHDLHELWNPVFFHFARKCFEKIIQSHLCVHIHPNNCCGISSTFGVAIPRVAEFTFLRKDCASKRDFATHFPHKLDFDNTNKKSLTLPENWFNRH